MPSIHHSTRVLVGSSAQTLANIGWGLNRSVDVNKRTWHDTCQGPATRLNRNIHKGMMRSFDAKAEQKFLSLHDTFSSHVDKSLGLQTTMLSRMTIPEARGVVHRRAGATMMQGFRSNSKLTNSSGSHGL